MIIAPHHLELFSNISYPYEMFAQHINKIALTEDDDKRARNGMYYLRYFTYVINNT